MPLLTSCASRSCRLLRATRAIPISCRSILEGLSFPAGPCATATVHDTTATASSTPMAVRDVLYPPFISPLPKMSPALPPNVLFPVAVSPLPKTTAAPPLDRNLPMARSLCTQGTPLLPEHCSFASECTSSFLGSSQGSFQGSFLELRTGSSSTMNLAGSSRGLYIGPRLQKGEERRHGNRNATGSTARAAMGNIGGTAGRYTYTSYSTPISTDSSTDDSTGSSSEYSTEGSTDGSMMDSTVFEAEDTIAAIATAVSGQSGGIAIVRMSGPEALSIASRVFVPVRNRARAANGTATRSKSNSTIEREEEEGEGEWVGRSENGGARSAWESHKAVYGHVMDHEKGLIVDEVLVLPMLGPRSYTREDVVEVHTHGGLVCADRVLQLLFRCGARPASPGEFTLRAFLNGRIDLSQAEAVGALLSSRSHAAADAALAATQGGLSGAVRHLRRECVEVLAEVEARVDFDEDLPPLSIPLLEGRVRGAMKGIQEALSTARRGRLLDAGIRVAIVGRPNVGKSSLLNAWTKTDKAIVTSIAGTTRDIVEAPFEVGGLPVRILDTAGIRATEDPVERIGVQRSEAAAGAADVVLFVCSSPEGWTGADHDVFARVLGHGQGQGQNQGQGREHGQGQGQGQRQGHGREQEREQGQSEASPCHSEQDGNQHRAHEARGVTAHERALAGEEASGIPATPAILVPNKSDLASPDWAVEPEPGLTPEEGQEKGKLPGVVRGRFQSVVATSATSGGGLKDLDRAVLEAIGAGGTPAGGRAWTVNERQARQLGVALESLERVAETLEAQLPLDMCSTDLRAAISALGQVSGEDDITEEVLTEIFARFCIGK